jgi:hypothetical protein
MMLHKVISLCGAVLVAQGCYSYVPLETETPPLGETVALQITDRGRVGLADRFGAGLVRVEGKVTKVDTADVVLNVFRVSQVGGTGSRWSGESVRLDRGFVGSVQKRELSRPRSWLLAGGITVGVVAFIASNRLLGLFSGDPADKPPDDPLASRVSARMFSARVVLGRLILGIPPIAGRSIH